MEFSIVKLQTHNANVPHARRVAAFIALSVFAFGPTLTVAAGKSNAPTLAEGVYRVDWNRKVRDLCVDVYTNDDFTAKDWQGVLGAQGVICKLAEVKPGKVKSSWMGTCQHPGMGKVVNITHRVSVETKKDGSFDILTVISGDMQATIPIRGEPIRTPSGAPAKCESDHAPFRPWQ
jgi:hypothetical protein